MKKGSCTFSDKLSSIIARYSDSLHSYDLHKTNDANRVGDRDGDELRLHHQLLHQRPKTPVTIQTPPILPCSTSKPVNMYSNETHFGIHAR